MIVKVTEQLVKNSTPSSHRLNYKNGGINKTYKEYHEGATEFKTILKYDGCVNEVLAYEVDRILGFGLVPVTVLVTSQTGDRYGKSFPASRQLWVGGRAGVKVGRRKDRIWRDQFVRMVIFDIIIANSDRHEWNFICDSKNNKLWAIDHGMCFGPLSDSRISAIGDWDCQEREDIRKSNWKNIRRRWMSKLPEKDLKRLRSITREEFMEPFMVHHEIPTGRACWVRLQHLLETSEKEK